MVTLADVATIATATRTCTSSRRSWSPSCVRPVTPWKNQVAMLRRSSLVQQAQSSSGPVWT